MGIHAPYEMGSDLELPRVSQPHTSNLTIKKYDGKS